MPSLQDIEQFKRDLNAIGNEEEILAERGETIQDVPPPADGLSDDLSQLLDLGGTETAPPGASSPDLAEADESSPNELVLDDTDIADAGAAIPDFSDSDLDDFDIDGIFPEEDGIGLEAPPDDLEASAPDAEDLFSGISEAEYTGLTGDITEVDSSEVDEATAPGSTDDDFSFDVDLEDEVAFEEVDESAPPAVEEDGAGLPDEDFEAFDFDDESFAEDETDEFAISEDSSSEDAGMDSLSSVEQTPAEDFDADFGFDEPTAEGGDEELFDGESLDALSEELGDGEDEFTIPDEFATDTSETAEGGEPEVTEFPDEFDMPFAESESTESMDFSDEGFDISEGGEGEGEISDVGEDDFDLDDFSLGDISEQFGITESTTDDLPSEEELNPALVVSEKLPGAEDELDLEDDQFEALQKSLANLPRNLRIIIEEAIGEEQITGSQLESLVDALVRGRSPKEIAVLAGRITGQRIIIPSAYEKRTGLEFEEEKGTFAYIFRYTILPIARTAALVLAAVGVLGFLGYRFVYRPIRATILYTKGLEQIDDAGYVAGNELFDQAKELWRTKRRYYQYADSFTEQRRHDLAAEKYEELLGHYGPDREGLLDYARLETYHRAAYGHAESLLEQLIGQNRYMFDYDGLIQYGDNYMEWALEDSDRYENARRAYATLIQEYGETDELLFRMLRYFIRTDNLDEVLILKDYFQSIDNLDLDTEGYAELGGYLITQDQNTRRSTYASDARDILFRAMEEDEQLPEIHYHLARHFRNTENYPEEKKALGKAFSAFGRLGNRNILRETRLIDTIDRQGELAFREGEYLQAEDKFLAAKKRFEAAESIGKLGGNQTFGRIYSNLGDVYYYASANFPLAMQNFREASKMDYAPPVLYYKMGYIHYRSEQYDQALLRFYESAGHYSSNVNLMFATANSLYYQHLYSAAQGYYLHVLTDLETQRRNIPDLAPDERPEHRALLENTMKAYNNLGVTLFRLSERTGDNRKVTQGLVNLTTASEYFDRITRDRETLVRTESKNLSFLNTRAIIYPEPGFEVEIYNEIPRDLQETGF